MTSDIHLRLAESGLLDGPIDQASVRAWPAWAREHLRVCPDCLSLLEAERELRRSLRIIAESRGPVRRLEPPAARWARLARRRPPPPDSLARGQTSLPRRQMRGEGAPLELVRTSRGVRLWHSDATEVLVLAAGKGVPPAVIKHAHEETPGISIDLALRPEQVIQVVAIAAREPLEEQHWLLWLHDALASGDLCALVAECSSDFLQLARVTIPAPMRASLLRLRHDPLPDASPSVTATLKSAAEAGREDRVVEASSRYQQALEEAFSSDDTSGQIKAAMGLSLALRGLGYDADADRVIRWLVEAHTLDSTQAGIVCRHLASHALNRMDLDTAQRWLDDAERFEGPDGDWMKLVRFRLRAARGQVEDTLREAGAFAFADVPAGARAKTQLLHAAVLAGIGDLAAARALIADLPVPDDAPLELRLDRAVFDVVCACQERDRAAIGAIIERVSRDVADKDGGLLAAWDHPALLRIAEEARQVGEQQAALRAFRLRFLDSERAADTSIRLLGLAAHYKGLLVCSPGEDRRLRRLPLPLQQVRSLSTRARDDLRGEDRLDACRALGTLLFNDGKLGHEAIWIGSDGLLSEVPMLALALSISPDGQAPPMRELVGPRRSPSRRAPGASTAIASLADALGDLPWAAREVGPSEAAIWLRGKQVTRARLALPEPVGLLHIGLHVRREQGVPQLLFADGPLGPVEIAATPLLGAPVVLLAGCATGVAQTADGVERSLADAFLRAGASAVIATRWPLEDRELQPFVRALLEEWPFEDVAATVTSVCLRLRRQGLPASLWAAPVVY